ncbi:hypothetical protein Droror1_Dr00013474 [Drosera rotundifolia]
MSTTPATTTRWRPTPDQRVILEELYVGGIKTPSAAQIRRITEHLSLYGKVECKNVFYWFQNHKAREKQKLRKRMLLGKQLQVQVPHHHMQLEDLPQFHHRSTMGNNYHRNDVRMYFVEPHHGCGFPHKHQGEGVKCGSHQMMESTLFRLYGSSGHDNNDPVMTPLITVDHQPMGPTCSSPSPASSSTTASTLAAATAATRPLRTLELFPTTATLAATKDVKASTGNVADATFSATGVIAF